MVLKYNERKYIILYNGSVATFEKFPDEYSAKVWALHNDMAYLKLINLKGDKKIVLKYGVYIEKMK